MIKPLLLLLVALTVFVACQVLPEYQYVEGVLRDQSDANMNLCSARNGRGSAGKANGGKGFPNTDFQMPMDYYKANEKGLVGAECNAGTGWYPPKCGKIGIDRTPEYFYTGQSPWKNIRSPASFYTWFHDSNMTKNVVYSVPLKKGSGNIYSYSNSSQFPLDGLGWEDYCGDGKNNQKDHNYGYCFEAHFSFGFQGGEIFKFTGDDDVWVYIDNRLVIDLGSLHEELSKEVRLSDIAGLEETKTYPFDFFYCERHTTESNMKIETSLKVFCKYRDWCGVCEGSGQSCCTKEVVETYCNDNKACTVDSCAILVPPTASCVHTPVVCNTTGFDTVCNTFACNEGTGKCEPSKISCDDNNPCTDDTCVPNVGCKSTPKNCNDGKICTTDSCEGGKCVYANVTCNDDKLCTTDSCKEPSGCSFIPITCPSDACFREECSEAIGGKCQRVSTKDCNDNSKCTQDSCDPVSGCKNLVLPCDDNNQCTEDKCTATGGCTFAPITCEDNDKCTNNTCNPSSGCAYPVLPCPAKSCQDVVCTKTGGCIYTPRVCNDRNLCTDDSCDVNTNQCKFTLIVCDDDSKCTNDACDATTGRCTFTSISCNDGNACTLDSCTNATGCSYATRVCNDNDACTVDKCDNVQGCLTSKLDCDDKNACTLDSCDKQNGCQYEPNVCNDGSACTTDTCNNVTGCNYAPVVCTTDKCNTVLCNNATGCEPSPITCNDNNLCTKDSCVGDKGCVFAILPCDDGDRCTNDVCTNKTGCVSTPVNCRQTDPCKKGECSKDTGKCVVTDIPDCTLCSLPTSPDCLSPVNTPDKCFPNKCNPADGKCIPDLKIDCNDNTNCTTDSCEDGKCTNTAITCNDNKRCTTDSCDPKNGCVYTPILCDDDNVCTDDTCSETTGKCVFTTLPCTDGNNCTTDKCDPKNGCKSTPVVCDDSSACTTESCNPATGKCDFKPVVCLKENCFIDSCNPKTGCSKVDKVCNDSNACTTDSCSKTSGECLFAAINCASATKATKCEIPSCDINNGCNKTAKVCNDNNPCTQDSCDLDTGDCEFVALDTYCVPCAGVTCTWSDSCNPQVCNTDTNKCEAKSVVCDDKSACTKDSCDGSGAEAVCEHADITCNTTDLCNPEICDIDRGCISEPKKCDDGNKCTDDSCEIVNGKADCLFTPKSCSAIDKCNPTVCNATSGTCEISPILCDDNNLCTADECSLEIGGCTYTLNTCSSNICSPEICNVTTGACDAAPIDCNDGNPCTRDTLVCNATSANKPECVHTIDPVVCDDNNTCTEDICDSEPGAAQLCKNVPLICAAVDNCHIDLGCVPGVGCVAELKECAKNATNTTDYCNLSKCDPLVGCTSEPRVCPNKDIGCFDAICDNVTRSCTEKRKDSFGSSKGKSGIICPLVWDKKAKTIAITGGALAGIIIGAVAAAALIGFGGKKGYDFLMAKNSPMGPTSTNPLYAQAATSGTNALYSA